MPPVRHSSGSASSSTRSGPAVGQRGSALAFGVGTRSPASSPYPHCITHEARAPSRRSENFLRRSRRDWFKPSDWKNNYPVLRIRPAKLGANTFFSESIPADSETAYPGFIFTPAEFKLTGVESESAYPDSEAKGADSNSISSESKTKGADSVSTLADLKARGAESHSTPAEIQKAGCLPGSARLQACRLRHSAATSFRKESRPLTSSVAGRPCSHHGR